MLHATPRRDRLDKITVGDLKSSSFTTPTSVVDLSIFSARKPLTLSGTENLIRLHLPNENFDTTPCPNMQELNWGGDTVAEKELPFPIADMTSLSALHCCVLDSFNPDSMFPTHLTSLWPNVMCGSVDVAVLTSLTRFRDLYIEVDKNEDPPRPVCTHDHDKWRPQPIACHAAPHVAC